MTQNPASSSAHLTLANVSAFLARVVDSQPGGASDSLESVIEQLAGIGLKPGSLVLLALPNSVRLLTHYFAVLSSGAVPLAISPATPSARIEALRRHLGARLLITGRGEAERFGIVHRLDRLSAVSLPAHPEPPPRYAPGEVALATTGTSGMSYACVHRVESLLRNAFRHSVAVGLGKNDVVLVNLPLYYSYALVAQAFAALVTDARLVISGPPFAPTEYRVALTRFGAHSSSITPTVARQLIAHGERLPAGLRMLTVGGDHLAVEHVDALRALLPRNELYLTYGLTEAGPRVSTLAAHAEPAHRLGSVGVPLHGVSVALRNHIDDATGELLVSSDTVLLRAVGETDRQPLIAPATIATGDIFHVDADGYLYFRGRRSDVVVLRGEKVSLHLVRGLAQKIPGVLRCESKIQNHPDGEAFLTLHVQVANPGDTTEDTIRSALAPVLLPSERPRQILVSAIDATSHK